MSKVYDALIRAQQMRGAGEPQPSLRDRLRRWIPGASPYARGEPTRPALPAPPPARSVLPVGPSAADLEERIASLQVSVDALDDRLSAEVVEREAKLLEELRRGMRGLESELSDRFAAAALEMRRTVQRGVALVVTVVALLAGLVVGALSLL